MDKKWLFDWMETPVTSKYKFECDLLLDPETIKSSPVYRPISEAGRKILESLTPSINNIVIPRVEKGSMQINKTLKTLMNKGPIMEGEGHTLVEVDGRSVQVEALFIMDIKDRLVRIADCLYYNGELLNTDGPKWEELGINNIYLK